jgi:hypothetical protein
MTAEAAFYIGFIGLCLLAFVGAAAALQWAEDRHPRLKAFLDRHWPEPERDVWQR